MCLELLNPNFYSFIDAVALTPAFKQKVFCSLIYFKSAKHNAAHVDNLSLLSQQVIYLCYIKFCVRSYCIY
jgi:hypothetical protein